MRGPALWGGSVFMNLARGGRLFGSGWKSRHRSGSAGSFKAQGGIHPWKIIGGCYEYG